MNASEPVILSESRDLAWCEIGQGGLATLCILDVDGPGGETADQVVWAQELLMVEQRRTLRSGDAPGRDFTRIVYADESLRPVFSRGMRRDQTPQVQRVGPFHVAELRGRWNFHASPAA